jgi:hypothetical protein
MTVLDGFWLPQSVRRLIISPDTEYTTLSLAHGRPCSRDDERGVTVRWPRLDQEQWALLLSELQENRRRAPVGLEYWDRLSKALAAVARRFAEPSDPLRIQALTALPVYTGYSEPMIRFTLSALDLMTLDQMPLAFSLSPSRHVTNSWQRMPGLPGRLRFYATNSWRFSVQRLLGQGDRTLFEGTAPPELAVGYGAGNVPGTALLIAFLAKATTLAGGAPPSVVVKNSRREPIFTSLVLQGLEAVDPDLVSSLGILIWDYEEEATQKLLVSRADLVIAAASDSTIAELQDYIDKNGRNGASPGSTHVSSHNTRFHAHGHKVSFSAIGSEVLVEDLADAASGQSLLDIVTRLAALDSVFWDQHGCLSSRVHFVETGGAGHYTAVEYASRLTSQLQILADFLPRGAWPRRTLHDRFDRYKLLETTGQVQVLSNYDDEYLVAVDQRPVGAARFQSAVNDCQGRVIIVRPTADLMEVPDRFLPMLPPENLQSLSVAVGHAGGGLTDRFLRFADACGARGVTAIRTVGRGAFPQLSYSWDGLIPLDLVRRRPAGRFTTIEFDAPWEQMLETHRALMERGTASTEL